MKNLETALENVEMTYQQINEIANDILYDKLESINRLIKEVELKSSGLPVDAIRDFMLRLQLKAYEISELKDRSALKAECAEAVRKEKYATSLLAAEGTASVKDTTATLASSEEIVVQLLYELIASLLKTKLDQLHRLTDVMKSLLMSKMQEAKFINLSAADDPDAYKTIAQIREENSRRI